MLLRNVTGEVALGGTERAADVCPPQRRRYAVHLGRPPTRVPADARSPGGPRFGPSASRRNLPPKRGPPHILAEMEATTSFDTFVVLVVELEQYDEFRDAPRLLHAKRHFHFARREGTLIGAQERQLGPQPAALLLTAHGRITPSSQAVPFE